MTGSDGAGYFLYHSIGLYPGKAADMAAGLAAFAGLWGAADDGQWPAALALRDRFLARWRALIGAPEGTLTTAESVTAALDTLMRALPAEHLLGRRVLVAADCFPSLHFLLAGLSPRLGFTLDTVALRPGAAWVEDEDFLARWDSDVGLALVTQVTSTASHRPDLARLAAHGRAKGSLVGVDITQGVGLVPFRVDAPAVDFAVSTSLKWLCGTPGAGILQVAAPLIARAAPELRGWFSQPNPFSWDLDAFAYAPDIRRFDAGTPSVVACAGSLPALDWHARQDAGALAGHNRALAGQIIAGADTLGLALASPRDPARRGGSVMLRLPAGAAPAGVVAGLRARGLHADCRGRILRLSPGIVTTAGGVDRLLSALPEVLSR
ncbi:MAG: aminotransferase class V-fold PLP-dependent enzyme [Rhodobacteraceae bacterium]|jgi:kynureninase|nr:aminotransferase class V-fold PLP-dependent enzyme [Paracoccaceae bacterium]